MQSLVTVVDANVLATAACYAARSDSQVLIERLALTGRSPLYVAPHVPDEVLEHLPRIADDLRVSLRSALRAYLVRLAPRIRVVELPMGEYLRPEVAALRNTYPDLQRHRGDPDDLGTAALAAFLAPSVIVSADSVFARFGLALASEWVDVARSLLASAGIEADWADTLALIEMVTRLTGAGFVGLWNVARQHPVAATLIAGVGLLISHRCGYLDRAALSSAVRRASDACAPIIERAGVSLDAWSRARSSLFVVEDPPWRIESVAERAGRLLARSDDPMTPSELRDTLYRPGRHLVSAAALKREMQSHPAFVRHPGDRYVVGQNSVETLISLARSVGSG